MHQIGTFLFDKFIKSEQYNMIICIKSEQYKNILKIFGYLIHSFIREYKLNIQKEKEHKMCSHNDFILKILFHK